MKSLPALLALSLLMLPLPACRRKAGKGAVVAAPVAGDPAEAAARRLDPAIRVPDAVKARWTAARIGLLDLSAKTETTFVVPVGADFTPPGTDLVIHPLVLIPDFTLDNGVITSRSESPANPAAQVLIRQGGRDLYHGWLFSRFPDAHPFEHPRYAVRLLELVQG